MKRLVIILGIILLVGGVVGLAHPNFSYHKQRPDPKKPTDSARSRWGLELRKQ